MDLKALVDKVFLPSILGIVGVGVSFIGDMSRNIREMTISVQELNLRMSQVNDTMRDHESRIRVIEYRKK